MKNLERALAIRERVKVLRQQIHGFTDRGHKYQVVNQSSYPETVDYYASHAGAPSILLGISLEKELRDRYSVNRPRHINDKALGYALAKIVEKNLPMLLNQVAELLEEEATDSVHLAEKEYLDMKIKMDLLRNEYPGGKDERT